MMRALLLTALALTAGLALVELTPTLAGIADEEQASGSFTADLCADRDCKLVEAGALRDHDCRPDEWRFVLTKMDPERAPRSIHVTWSDGDAAVGLHDVAGGSAHYRTSSYLDQDVEKATARVPEDWDGRFNLGEGPCAD